MWKHRKSVSISPCEGWRTFLNSPITWCHIFPTRQHKQPMPLTEVSIATWAVFLLHRGSLQRTNPCPTCVGGIQASLSCCRATSKYSLWRHRSWQLLQSTSPHDLFPASGISPTLHLNSVFPSLTRGPVPNTSAQTSGQSLWRCQCWDQQVPAACGQVTQ